ncbi:LamG domain-containing protein [Chengkuizengella marina]|uniref:LamG domain-containing protein n=1 Tax=Chengkuizengella marina TaxID=2507566 RepID=A0A6N9PZM9_9BACL|nr:LamG domain-containing protein [Chengkuizengella marina]NBI28065.1 LamG domain-containing protein [Chengkuizengella marina]
MLLKRICLFLFCIFTFIFITSQAHAKYEYFYDESNRLDYISTVSGSKIDFEYDSNGNLIKRNKVNIREASLAFDGVDDYVDIGVSNAFTVSELTMEAWIKTPEEMSQQWRNIVSKSEGNDVSTRDYNFYVQSTEDFQKIGYLHFSSGIFGASIVELPTPYEPNTWHHIAVTVDNTGLQKYYSDGEYIGEFQGVAGIADNDYPLWIGKSNNLWNGIMKDVRLWNKARSEEEILSTINKELIGNESGLIGYWKLDELEGTIAYDSAKHGHPGTIVGEPLREAALAFDGVDDYVDIGVSNAFSVSELTMEAWIKTPEEMGQQWRNIVSKSGGNDVSTRDYNFYVQSTEDFQKIGYLHFSSGIFGASIVELPTPYEPNTWHHIAVTVDNTGLQKYYSDGKYIGEFQGVAGIADNDYPLWIGKSNNLWNGIMKDVRLWNKARSEEEILSTMNKELIGNESGLMGYWKLDELEGTIAYDSAKHGHPGTIVGEPLREAALAFDGVDDYVDIGVSNAFTVSELTIEAWIKTPEEMGQQYRIIVSKENGTVDTRNYNFYVKSTEENQQKISHLHFSSAIFGSTNIELETPYEPNTWHHIAVTVDSTGLQKYYSDGKYIGEFQGVAGIANNDYPLWIGKTWNGTMKDVRLWNKARSEEEILFTMNKELIGNESGLIGYWKLDGQHGILAMDYSPYKSDGTIYTE